MADPAEPTIRVEHPNITSLDSSHVHLGNIYNTNTYYKSTQRFGDTDSKTQALIDSLWYPELHQRENQIHDADEYEYDWAFETSSTALGTWLTTAEGIFWVAGKAGSGKSTFMKFLRHHAETERLLELWYGSRKLIIAAHYFWHSGTQSLQRRRDGLYRSLLYQALESLPTALPSVFTERWKGINKGLGMQPDWNTKELLRGLRNFFALSDTAFVFFIDGLDECDPSSEHGILITELETFAKCENVKICVSSRPWKPFEPRFRNSKARLNLQDLTHRDIVRYVTKELVNTERDAGLDIGLRKDYPEGSTGNLSMGLPAHLDATQGNANLVSESERHSSEMGDSGEEDDGVFDERPLTFRGSELVYTIATHSEGVFLWVYLILRDLRDEIFAGRQIGELLEFVEKTPSDLMKYYELGIRNRIGERREREVAMAFKIVVVLAEEERRIENPTQQFVEPYLCFLHFWRLQTADGVETPQFGTLAPVEELSDRDFLQMRSKTSAFLGEVCRDLIYVEDHFEGRHVSLSRIQFLHRSVLDYLTEPGTLAWIDERIPTHFKKPRFFFELSLARMKLVPAALAESRSITSALFQIMTNVLKVISQRIVRQLRESTSDDIKIEFEDVSAELVRQYEDIAIRYVRLCYDGDCFPDPLPFTSSVRQCTTLFLILGFTGFLSETYKKQPSLAFGPMKHDSFRQVLPQLFNHETDQKVYHVVKVMLDMGLYCGIKPWHHFLYLWWHFNRERKQEEQFLDEFGKRVWRIAKLLLLDGVDTSTMLCLAHPPDNEICAVYQSPHKTPCLLRTPASVLSELVPETLNAELLTMLSQDAVERRKIDIREYRRKKRIVGYRKGLERKLQQSSDRQSAESSYATWVHRNEATLEDYYKVFHGYVQRQQMMFNSPICQSCGVAILRHGCFRWVCLSCLEYDHCTLCLPTVRKAHTGQFQCMEGNIGRFQIEVREGQKTRDGDRTVVGFGEAPWPSSELSYCVMQAIFEWSKPFERGIRNHETTKNLSHGQAFGLILSIILETVCLERHRGYLLEDPQRCMEVQLEREKKRSSTAPTELVEQSVQRLHRPSLPMKQDPPKGGSRSDKEVDTYRLIVDI